jgi:thiol-disulfide isomerase/thioredoxin
MKAIRPLMAAALMSTFGISGIAVEAEEMETRSASASRVQRPDAGKLASLTQATAWLNSEALKGADLRGKVVLIDFWTYTCINWMRTLPYLRAWADRYKDDGLVVIGVHTPEFSFEKNVDNVRRAAKEQKVDYPVAIDSHYAIWRAFDNHYWPALYLIDAQGRLRHHQFGEGAYDQAERMIQRLLAEAGSRAAGQGLVAVDARGIEVDADWKNLRSPETYLGYARAENRASPGRPVFDRTQAYAAPAHLKLNTWALAGNWVMKKELALLSEAGGKLSYRFHARDLHLVMAPARPGAAVRFRVLVDGRAPEAAQGLDIDGQGHGTVVEPRMYQLIRQQGPVEERLFEIEFLDPGVEVYAFTFG